MKLTINQSQLKDNLVQFLRQAGYAYVRDSNDELEFARELGSGGYPRFHLYTRENGDQVILNLHLDQKRPGYAGQSRHNAEYEGELVSAEMERIRGLIN